MLRISVLNVGHGDSIVVEYINAGRSFYGVIDSNRDTPSIEPPALTLLRSRNATELSFLLLTHPHADHFCGLAAIMDAMPVRTFYSYPMRRDLRRLKSAGAKYLDAAMRSGSLTIKNKATEFVKLIVAAHGKCESKEMEWLDLEGPTNRVRPEGFGGVTIHAMLPFKKVKGEYFNALDANRPDALEAPLENELSVAIDIEYGDYRIALCGDATRKAWADHKRELRKANERVSFAVAKLPHHGSAEDCDTSVIDYLFEQPPKYSKPIGLVSAEGSKHHPAPAVLKALQERGVQPYCTNLSVVCGNNVRPMLAGPQISAEVAKFLNISGARPTSGGRIPCQGNICVTVPASGELIVDRQYNNACAYRGDLAFLGSGATI